ncbi:Poxvirus A32 protein [Popillia japonica]|uniref:Poxvirus A32 protein n=1 Tax=Popillia japonica TaxID=7064 RepID=A0AAW1HX76_POPJA
MDHYYQTAYVVSYADLRTREKLMLCLRLLIDENGLRFNNVYIYSKSLYQPKYQFLQKVLSAIPKVKYFPYRESEDILDPSQARENSIFIFDDVASDKQNKIKDYFSMGRHKAIDCFYLCQTYARIPKHLIRDNANFLIVFKQDDLNLRHIYDDHVGADMSFERFKRMCSECWKEKYNFLVIDKDRDMDKGRYRKLLDTYIK